MYTSFDQWFDTKNILNNGKLEEHKELFEECWNNVESLHKKQIEDLEDQVFDFRCEVEETEDYVDELKDWKTDAVRLLESLKVSDEDKTKITKLIKQGEDL